MDGSPLFRNFDEHGNQLGRPRTLLIDSAQIDSGEALDDKFRDMASDEIDRFRREIIERTGDRQQAEKITDEDLLREVMNDSRQGRAAWRSNPLRRVSLDAHGGMGHKYRYPCTRRTSVRDAAIV